MRTEETLEEETVEALQQEEEIIELQYKAQRLYEQKNQLTNARRTLENQIKAIRLSEQIDAQIKIAENKLKELASMPSSANPYAIHYVNNKISQDMFRQRIIKLQEKKSKLAPLLAQSQNIETLLKKVETLEQALMECYFMEIKDISEEMNNHLQNQTSIFSSPETKLFKIKQNPKEVDSVLLQNQSPLSQNESWVWVVKDSAALVSESEDQILCTKVDEQGKKAGWLPYNNDYNQKLVEVEKISPSEFTSRNNKGVWVRLGTTQVLKEKNKANNIKVVGSDYFPIGILKVDNTACVLEWLPTEELEKRKAKQAEREAYEQQVAQQWLRQQMYGISQPPQYSDNFTLSTTNRHGQIFKEGQRNWQSMGEEAQRQQAVLLQRSQLWQPMNSDESRVQSPHNDNSGRVTSTTSTQSYDNQSSQASFLRSPATKWERRDQPWHSNSLDLASSTTRSSTQSQGNPQEKQPPEEGDHSEYTMS